MTLHKKAIDILKSYSLCDYCLGRQFSNLSTGTTNKNRGSTIKDFLTLFYSTDITDDTVLILQALSRADNKLAKNTLSRNNFEIENSEECYICQNTLTENSEEIIQKVLPEIKDYEFQTFLIGTSLPKEFFERERNLKEEFNVVQTEYLKQEFNRLIGGRIGEFLSKETDFQSPEIVIEINPLTYSIVLKLKSLYIYGRYRKYIRTLPQTRWPCRKCKGRGCIECNHTGKKHQESVEELAEYEALKLTHGYKGVLHGAGREDIDALMLGTGRPFVLEIVKPKVRTIDLRELEKNTNQYGKGKIDVSEYRWSSKNELRDLKSSAERTVKKYKALITFKEPISEKKIKEIEEFFQNRPIDQRTPQRVSHRRADLIRKKTAFSVQCSRINETHIEAIITCDGGCYVKELISGDNNRTKPSIAEVIGIEAKCKELDVIEIQDGFNEA